MIHALVRYRMFRIILVITNNNNIISIFAKYVTNIEVTNFIFSVRLSISWLGRTVPNVDFSIDKSIYRPLIVVNHQLLRPKLEFCFLTKPCAA